MVCAGITLLVEEEDVSFSLVTGRNSAFRGNAKQAIDDAGKEGCNREGGRYLCGLDVDWMIVGSVI